MLTNKLYEQTNLSTYMIDELVVPFDPGWKTIGINLSGGADIALLTYILCDIISKNNFNVEVHIITYHRCWKKRPWQIDISIQVFEKIKELFSDIKFQRHQGYIPPEIEWGSIGPIIEDTHGRKRSGDQITVSSFNEYIMCNFKIDATFEATTRNPDIEIQGKMPNREKSPENAVLKDLVFSNTSGLVFSPFKFVRKDWIYRQYKNNSLLDLYSITRSCEGEFEDIDHKTYVSGQYVPVCGECFWCKERIWAENLGG
jgi:hypothetical protein